MNYVDLIYDSTVRDTGAISAAVDAKCCVYCNNWLETPEDNARPTEHGAHFLLLRCCPVCGGWTKREEHRVYDLGFSLFASPEGRALYDAAGSLRELDLTDQSIPIEGDTSIP